MTFPALSLTISILSFLMSIYAATRALRTSVRPVLIFHNAEYDPERATSWVIENAGNGAAIEVIISGYLHGESWTGEDAVILPALPKGGSRRLEWLDKRQELVATYKDIFGNHYTTECKLNQTVIKRGKLHDALNPRPLFRHLSERANRALSTPAVLDIPSDDK